MKSIKDILNSAQTQDLMKSLQAAGIEASLYKRPPVNKETAILSRDKNIIKIWPGISDIQVFTDKKLNQAVIIFKEKARKIIKKVKDSASNEIGFKTRCERGGNFPVNLNNATYKVVGEITPIDFNYYSNMYIATVEARIKASTNTFLIGRDETTNFISLLPKQVFSVKEAHDILRPKDIPKNAPRQGEFFFVPVDDEIAKKLDEYIEEKPELMKSRNLKDSWDRDHYAHQLITFNKERYVCGYITDARKHHAPLYLNDWHRVVRNTEKEPRNTNTNKWD